MVQNLRASLVLHDIIIKWMAYVQEKIELCRRSQRPKLSSAKISGHHFFAAIII